MVIGCLSYLSRQLFDGVGFEYPTLLYLSRVITAPLVVVFANGERLGDGAALTVRLIESQVGRYS